MNDILNREFKVLDKGTLALIDMLPHPATNITPDMAIVAAARTSFLGTSKGNEKDKRLLFRLMKDKHTSPFEQVEFKFLIHAPVITLWQLVRHRTASLNLSSGRYTEFKEDQFYVPNIWRKQSTDNKQASEGVLGDVDSAYLTRKLFNRIEEGYADYQFAMSKGVAREQARLFLHGWASYYTCVWKIDAHNLMHFLKLRMARDAQEEIRVYADVMYQKIFTPLMPWTAEAFELYR